MEILNTIWDKQIYILKELREKGANICPIKLHDFQKDFIQKVVSDEDSKVCFALLEKRNFIKIDKPGVQHFLYLIWITDEGVEEIERFDYEEKSKNRLGNLEKWGKTSQSRIVWLTRWIAFGTVVAALYYLNELYLKGWFHWF